jgi:hypothetical protein
MFVTHRPCGAKPQVKGAQRQTGRPNLESIYKSIPCQKVGGDQEEWLTSHVDGRPAVHHLQTESTKSVEALLDLYIRIIAVEFTHTTLYL